MKNFCAVLMLLICGCASNPNDAVDVDINVSRLPDAIIGFNSGSSDFNNVTGLEYQILGSGVLLVANANHDTFQLAESRLRSVANRFLDKKEVFVSYRYSNRSDDMELVEVFSYDSDSFADVIEILKQVNQSSLDAALGLRFTEQDTRDLEFEVRRKTISVLDADSPTSQLRLLLQSLGWELTERFEFVEAVKTIPYEMDVILADNTNATESELMSIISEWLRIYRASEKGFSVALDFVSKKVEIFR